ASDIYTPGDERFPSLLADPEKVSGCYPARGHDDLGGTGGSADSHRDRGDCTPAGEGIGRARAPAHVRPRHKIQRIIVLDHRDCGAYKIILGFVTRFCIDSL